ncbi:hypothetical protein IC762_27100 [Bradyrhizobium genosp. L]|uniref:hypothetical protein n=1 Tax=Bradyrhizobium genosp. L TaxID=83637 RepID=UPI0018A2F933|nr:hypothetical protein [Bradyrhizobium genosp. L]QPF83350.1 hypothetical protein IC762_27100 [Bradyrhizobium genosp. L]
MTGEAEPSLPEQWLGKLKNRPAVAVLIVLATIVTGVASFWDTIGKLVSSFGDAPKPPSVVVTLPTPTPPPPPPAKRVSFAEDFSLGENDAYTSSHGISIRTHYIMMENGIVAEIGASATGDVELLQKMRRGQQIALHRNDCDWLTVTIKDIDLSPQGGMTFDQLSKMGPAAEMFITRKVVGNITGRCEE